MNIFLTIIPRMVRVEIDDITSLAIGPAGSDRILWEEDIEKSPSKSPQLWPDVFGICWSCPFPDVRNEAAEFSKKSTPSDLCIFSVP